MLGLELYRQQPKQVKQKSPEKCCLILNNFTLVEDSSLQLQNHLNLGSSGHEYNLTSKYRITGLIPAAKPALKEHPSPA